jgi:hypothetical protein
MHMDESKNSISPIELDLRSAPDQLSAVVEALPADLASSRNPIPRERPPPADQITPWPNDASRGASTVVYCGSEEEVRQGFLMALKAMGVAVVDEPTEAAKAPVAGVKP